MHSVDIINFNETIRNKRKSKKFKACIYKITNISAVYYHRLANSVLITLLYANYLTNIFMNNNKNI